MTIDVLYFEDCPHYELTVDLVQRTIDALGVSAVVRRIAVETIEAAERVRFLGSPSVLVDGVDIDPDAHDRSDYGLACRRYGTSGVPPREMIAQAIRGSTEEKA
ncbi:MAG: hypothetical protein IH969_05905 [Candidatus Krumholzibacteriota bacterium]|nr:hypothetical protein [Candidatus Krumholzibacteriota bacterium]